MQEPSRALCRPQTQQRFGVHPHAKHLLQVPYLALPSATRQRTENRRMPQGTSGAFGLAVQRPVRGMHNIGLI